MSASATLQGLQVLRREIKIASLSMVNPEAMKNIRVVTVEVGTVDADGHHQHHRQGTSGSTEVQMSMESWSASEKSVYGQSFLTMNGRNVQVEPGNSRKPTPVSHFVGTIVNIVNGRSYGNGPNIPLPLGALYKLRSWLRGDRVSVGAGGERSSSPSMFPVVDAFHPQLERTRWRPTSPRSSLTPSSASHTS